MHLSQILSRIYMYPGYPLPFTIKSRGKIFRINVSDKSIMHTVNDTLTI